MKQIVTITNYGKFFNFRRGGQPLSFPKLLDQNRYPTPIHFPSDPRSHDIYSFLLFSCYILVHIVSPRVNFTSSYTTKGPRAVFDAVSFFIITIHVGRVFSLLFFFSEITIFNPVLSLLYYYYFYAVHLERFTKLVFQHARPRLSAGD